MLAIENIATSLCATSIDALLYALYVFLTLDKGLGELLKKSSLDKNAQPGIWFQHIRSVYFQLEKQHVSLAKKGHRDLFM